MDFRGRSRSAERARELIFSIFSRQIMREVDTHSNLHKIKPFVDQWHNPHIFLHRSGITHIYFPVKKSLRTLLFKPQTAHTNYQRITRLLWNASFTKSSDFDMSVGDPGGKIDCPKEDIISNCRFYSRR